MKTLSLLLISLFIVTSQNVLAQDDDCSKYRVTDSYEINTQEYKDLDISISYGLGDLLIAPSNKKHDLHGLITFDERRIKPIVEIESVSSSGVLIIKTKKNKDKSPCGNNFKGLKNEMEFYFPPKIKTDLFLDFGVGDAEIDLTNISLTKLDINCGLSKVAIEINKRNDVICKTVSIENGLGDLEISGLGNLAAKDIDINIGLGSAEIDFTGGNIYDTDINVDVGLGSLEMILPKNANIEIDVDASFLSSVDIYGLTQKKNKLWVSPNWNSNYPTITMDINVGMGSVDIAIEE